MTDKKLTWNTDRTWVSDENNNRCSVAYFGTEEAAETALRGLLDCRNCVNCSGCEDCSGCTNCSGCTDCWDCTGCTNCSGCTDCLGCTNCTDCFNCINCINCTDCTDCINCTDCTDCSGCTECVDCAYCTDCSGKTPAKGDIDAPPEIPVIPDMTDPMNDTNIAAMVAELRDMANKIPALWPDKAADMLKALQAQLADTQEAYDDTKRLAREIDIAMHGAGGAAKQASLCDLVHPAADLRARLAAMTEAHAAAVARVGVLEESAAHVLHDIDELAANSEGVSGLHMNGEIAEWSSIMDGGAFGAWLCSAEVLRAAIAAKPQAAPVRVGVLTEAVEKLGLRKLVAGWNGEHRKEQFAPHPPQLGVTLKTTAGVVYEIDAAMRALAALVQP